MKESFVILLDTLARARVTWNVQVRSNQMAITTRSRREKVGSVLGLVMGLIAFNLIVPLLPVATEMSDMTRMIGAMVSAMLCAELGARIGKWRDAKEQAGSAE